MEKFSKLLLIEDNANKFEMTKYKGIDLLKKLSSLINTKLSTNASPGDDKNDQNLDSSSVSFSDNDDDDEEEDDDHDEEDDDNGHNESLEQKNNEKIDANNEPTCKVVDIDDLSVDSDQKDEDEIKIDDLPSKLNLQGI